MAAIGGDTPLPFSLQSICGKEITAGFQGGKIGLDSGVILLGGADKRLGLIERLTALIPDDRDPDQITHAMADVMQSRVIAIACGYPDANDLDTLPLDPAFKLDCGRLPESIPRSLRTRPCRCGRTARSTYPDPTEPRTDGSVVPELPTPAEGHHPQGDRIFNSARRLERQVSSQPARLNLLREDPLAVSFCITLMAMWRRMSRL